MTEDQPEWETVAWLADVGSTLVYGRDIAPEPAGCKSRYAESVRVNPDLQRTNSGRLSDH